MFLFLIILTCFSGCGNRSKGELRFIEKPRKNFLPLINKSTRGGTPDHNADKMLYNDEYPISLTIYENGSFYYDLPNLGEGKGKWTYEGGEIKLQANYHIKSLDFTINMDYFLGAIDEKGNFGVFFKDRFGPKQLRLTKKNFPAE